MGGVATPPGAGGWRDHDLPLALGAGKRPLTWADKRTTALYKREKPQ